MSRPVNCKRGRSTTTSRCSGLVASFEADPNYALVFQNDGAAIFERKSAIARMGELRSTHRSGSKAKAALITPLVPLLVTISSASRNSRAQRCASATVRDRRDHPPSFSSPTASYSGSDRRTLPLHSRSYPRIATSVSQIGVQSTPLGAPAKPTSTIVPLGAVKRSASSTVLLEPTHS